VNAICVALFLFLPANPSISRNAPAVTAATPEVEIVMFVLAVAGVPLPAATAATFTVGFANEQMPPGGRFEHENVTVPLNPFSAVTVSGAVTACPETTVRLEGPEREKSGMPGAETT